MGNSTSNSADTAATTRESNGTQVRMTELFINLDEEIIDLKVWYHSVRLADVSEYATCLGYTRRERSQI